MKKTDEITLIEQKACPKCHVPRLKHCRRQGNETRIWPFAEGTAGPDWWVHPERRDLALAERLITQAPGYEEAMRK
jgi:hypothetical protein